MSDKLQDLENEIKKQNKNRENMTAELDNLATKISRLQDDQQAQILAGKDAAKVENELLAATIRSSGLTKVLAVLGDTLAKLAADREAVIFERAKAEASIKKQYVMGMVKNVYKSIDTTLATLEALQGMNNEYSAIVNGLGLRDPQLDNIVYMVNKFSNELPRMVAPLPANIWNESTALLKA